MSIIMVKYNLKNQLGLFQSPPYSTQVFSQINFLAIKKAKNDDFIDNF